MTVSFLPIFSRTPHHYGTYVNNQRLWEYGGDGESKEYYRKDFPYDILRGPTCYAVRDTKIIKLKNSYEIRP